ncbi:hypothetical protein P692DRAFT_201916938 [Suillus brevipes Sb2]|nr:hypothetical protein P692DRAFT_201916938 [Suillus brevipes Sb2]
MWKQVEAPDVISQRRDEETGGGQGRWRATRKKGESRAWHISQQKRTGEPYAPTPSFYNEQVAKPSISSAIVLVGRAVVRILRGELSATQSDLEEAESILSRAKCSHGSSDMLTALVVAAGLSGATKGEADELWSHLLKQHPFHPMVADIGAKDLMFDECASNLKFEWNGDQDHGAFDAAIRGVSGGVKNLQKYDQCLGSTRGLDASTVLEFVQALRLARYLSIAHASLCQNDGLNDAPYQHSITVQQHLHQSLGVWLCRAQAAILNPNVPSATFHAKTVEELRSIKNTLKFSRNVVCVSIEDPNATDLSFYDLPGKFNTKRRSRNCRLGEKFGGTLHREKNTIILTTILMSALFSTEVMVSVLDDMENQQSMSLARAADPNGWRTIGVLTKPDTLGTGAVNQRRKWVEIIEGNSEDHTLRHGFYCRLSRAESQRRAVEHFDTTSPWKDVIDRRRFGILGFVSDISQLPIQLIEEVLPCLREDVDALLARSLVECV